MNKMMDELLKYLPAFLLVNMTFIALTHWEDMNLIHLGFIVHGVLLGYWARDFWTPRR